MRPLFLNKIYEVINKYLQNGKTYWLGDLGMFFLTKSRIKDFTTKSTPPYPKNRFYLLTVNHTYIVSRVMTFTK